MHVLQSADEYQEALGADSYLILAASAILTKWAILFMSYCEKWK